MKPKKLLNRFHYGQRAFTLIELLIVVAMLGVLAAVAIPSLTRFMNEGKTEAGQTEKHNVQLAVQVMLADAKEVQLDDDYDEVKALAQIQQVTAGAGAYSLDNYLHLLGGSSEFSQAYDIARDGTVTVD